MLVLLQLLLRNLVLTPISKLTNFAETVAATGRFDRPVTNARSDEIGILANSLNEMISGIAELKILRGLLNVCCSCKQIKDDDGTWHPMETYIDQHSEAQFTRGYCPKCEQQLHVEMESFQT